MRLFLAGSNKVYAIENFYIKYLRELGVEIVHFPAQSMFYDYYQKNILNKIIYRSGLSRILKEINNDFKESIEEFKPDIIWVFKGMEIFTESLEWAKSKKISLVNYNGDSPFIFSGKGSGNKNVSGSIPVYDMFLTYNSADKEEMEARYGIRSEILPFGYDLDERLFQECESAEEVQKACFLGNPDQLRAKFLTDLAKLNVKIDVYGHHWKKFINHPNITVCEPVYNDDFWKTLRKYRVQLNLMRPHNLTTHNMRTFEAAGVGAIQLAPDTPDHQLYFKENKEIILFNDVASCYDKIVQLMNISRGDSLKIRESARLRSKTDGYSYKSRSAQALKFLNDLDFTK